MTPDVAEEVAAAGIATVVLVPSPGGLGPLKYRLPDGLGRITPGTRVLVPLGGRRAMGVVVAADDETAVSDGTTLRDVIVALDPEPVLDASLLALVQWMADYYLSSLGEAFATVLPSVLRVDTERVAVVDDGAAQFMTLTAAERKIVTALGVEGGANLTSFGRRFGADAVRILRRLQRRGAVRVVERLRRETAPTRHLRVYEAAMRVGDDDERL